MSHQDIIEKLWDQRDQINFIEDNEAKKNVESVLNLLDEGKLRVCEKLENDWHVNQWLKKAILLSCLLYTSPSPRDPSISRMPSSA